MSDTALITMHRYGILMEVRNMANVRAGINGDVVHDFTTADAVLNRMNQVLTVAQSEHAPKQTSAAMVITADEYEALCRLQIVAMLSTVNRMFFDFGCLDAQMRELCAAVGRNPELEWPRR